MEINPTSMSEREEIDILVVNAKAEAEGIIRRAHDRSTEIIQKAHIEAFEKRALADAYCAQVKSETERMKKEIIILEDYRKELDASIVGLENEIAKRPTGPSEGE
jgi:cell division septum initiation protein DivIVA